MTLTKTLTYLERQEIKSAVEEVFERYRFYKRFVPLRDKVLLTLFDNEQEQERVVFCSKVDRAVSRLTAKERQIIELRFMRHDNVREYKVQEIDLGWSRRYYDEVKLKAMIKLALILKLNCKIDHEKVYRFF